MGRYDQNERKKPVGATISIVAILFAGGAWFYVNRPIQPTTEAETKPLALPSVPDSAAAEETTQNQAGIDLIAPETADLENQAQPETVASETLPELAGSDPAFRQTLLGLSPQLEPWLKSDQLIRNYLTLANDFSQGLRLEKHMRFLKPSQPFIATQTADGLFMASESYNRYDALAAAIDIIDPKAAAAVYRKFKPLLLEVFNDFGYPPERPLEDIFLKSATQILAAPLIEQPIALVRPSVFYKYADEKLEGLSPVGKQMLRMGPKNTRIIQDKVRQLVQELVNSQEQAGNGR